MSVSICTARTEVTKQNPVANRLYSPQPILNRTFAFSEETSAIMADGEIAFTRIDEKSVRFPYKSSLRKALMRLEAVSTVCVEGITPDLDSLLILEALNYPLDHKLTTATPLDSIKDARIREATLDALRYEKLTNFIAHHPRDTILTEANLLNFHAYLRHGVFEGEASHYRQAPYHVLIPPGNTNKTVYVPPKPDSIPSLMKDLLTFASTNRLSPVTQAAVAHFQLEAIRPFKTAMDRTGRSFAHAILRKRGFSEHLVPPIALVPAMNIEQHARLLLPYRTGRRFTEKTVSRVLDRWVLHCAHCIVLSTKLTEIYMTGISELVEQWKARIGEYRQGSALDILLQELPGIPMVSVSTTMALTGKGFSAANEAIGQLIKKGILQPIKSAHRNRYFKAPDVIEMERRIFDQAIPDEIGARESYCEQ